MRSRLPAARAPGARRAPCRRTRRIVGTPIASAAAAVLAVGSMPRHGIPADDEVPEQIAVVRGHLDDQAVGAEPEPRDHRLRVAARVIEPAARDGREVGIVVRRTARRPRHSLPSAPASTARTRTASAGRSARGAADPPPAGTHSMAARSPGRGTDAAAARRSGGSSQGQSLEIGGERRMAPVARRQPRQPAAARPRRDGDLRVHTALRIGRVRHGVEVEQLAVGARGSGSRARPPAGSAGVR